MKFTNSIEIALPREQVARLLSDPAHFPSWLRGLVSHEPEAGLHGHVGTRSRVVFRSGEREVRLTETITGRSPDDLDAIAPGTEVVFERELETEGMWSRVRDRLTEAGPGATHWQSDSEYRTASRFFRLVMLLTRRGFRQQTQQHLDDFKAFAEQGRDVRDTER